MNIRLYVASEKLIRDQIINIDDTDFNYLIKVMRCKTGDKITVFNGKNGAWLAQIIVINKKNCQIQILQQTTEQYFPPRIALAFAPVKNVRIDFIAAKATELGITDFYPVITKNTIVNKINIKRFEANIKEAAEQCRRTDLPQIHQVTTLNKYIKSIKTEQILILCDESGSADKAGKVLSNINYQKDKNQIVIFTGPEAGFAKEEFAAFNELKNLHRISLGPRILRADTAIISAITLVQEFLGDFNLKPQF